MFWVTITLGLVLSVIVASHVRRSGIDYRAQASRLWGCCSLRDWRCAGGRFWYSAVGSPSMSRFMRIINS
ncbi:MAG: hypothetical protein U0V87_17285 [Acidobacteriota bacterium]